ncbi:MULTISPECIES: DUF3016 domain-containing protein [Oleiagrimonas]|jgi:hypothetical protein|uniref:DUF3016 domain-containing protein n=1 Tax=Oleiagrimonas citrea TaxID=1665687 RepID=A0A846ZR06_9GAMM|nr:MULTISPECIES: DUF3016 domain-containing protein [Oleiagrimonas]NKZ39853.1 DUF3016 domain-containing protein [Oleiagrimonas citrea]RAP56904.1 hypothetical protein BTJ49_12210 [Oleiagrimonas sp. MCCC 1A03011]
MYAFRIAFAAALLLISSASLASPTQNTPSVQVRYDDPAHFTEARTTPPSERTGADDYLVSLKRYIEHRAARILAPGQHLSIVITDIDRAGSFEPRMSTAGHWIRVIRRTYPPRIDLRFTLTDTNGKVLREGTRKLTSPNFMTLVSPTDTDNLRYEKLLIDRWLRKGTQGL